MTNLGTIYYNGIGREIDYKNAIKYYNKAIKEYQKNGIKLIIHFIIMKTMLQKIYMK